MKRLPGNGASFDSFATFPLIQMLDFLVYLARHLQCDFFIYDYSGYGASTGIATEGNACKDATAAYQVQYIYVGCSNVQLLRRC